MSAQERKRTTLVAVAFALAMLALGLLNPNANPSWGGCGAICVKDAAAAGEPRWAGG